MEVKNLIEKCKQHSKAFATEVEKLWDTRLEFDSGLARKTRNTIRNILRDITKSLTTNKKTKCFRILESSTINGKSIKDQYKTIFNKGVNVASNINTVGKYILFMVMTYAAAELRLVKPKDIIAVLTRLFNTICDVHDKYGCGNMFVGVPAALINKLDLDDINEVFTVFSTRHGTKAYVYNEFFIFMIMNHHFQEDDNVVNVEYGSVSLTTSISVPDYVMEALTFKACDRIMKSEDLKFVYVFTKKSEDLNNIASDSIFNYVRLVDSSYDDGVSEDTDDDDEVFAILNYNISPAMDRYRNRVLLLTPEVIILRQHEKPDEAYPDYRYLMDEEVPIHSDNLPKPITNMESSQPEGVKEERVVLQSFPPDVKNQGHENDSVFEPFDDKNHVPILTKTALPIADYQLVINKLVEWLDQCEKNCGEGYDGEFKEKLEDAKKKISEMNSEINDKIGKITLLERDSKYKTERIESLTREIKHLRDMQNGSDDCVDPDIDKKTIKELRETIDKEREMRRELEKELDTIRGGNSNGSCQRELELSRMWLRQRDDDLRAEIDKRRNIEWELSRLRRDISECDRCKTDLDRAKETINNYTIRISTLESEISKYQQTNETLSKVRRELDDEKRRVRELETRLDECRREQQNTQEVDYLNSRIRELETKLADCMESNGGDSAEINKLRATITDLERRLNECRRNNETNPDTEREMERMRNRIMDLDRQLNECKRNNGGSSSDEVDRLKNRIKDLERSLELCSMDESGIYSEYKSELERVRHQVSDLRESLRRERESDKNDSYYRRELTRERSKIVELENALNKCFDDNHAKYIDEINSHKSQISHLRQQITECQSNGSGNGNIDQYKREIEFLKRDLEDCRRGNSGSNDCKFFDEEAREEVKRLRKELVQLHDDLKRARESDKNDSYYKRELERQRVKVVELEKELERYFDDRRLEECKKRNNEMMTKIADLEKRLRDGNNGGGSCGHSSNCDFERKRIAVLEAELRRCMDTIKVLEKFIEFDRLKNDYSDKLETERERRMKAESDLEREIARKNCGGDPCERELESERNKLKKLEYQLDAEKEKVKFYKRELERNRYLTSNHDTSPIIPVDTDTDTPQPIDIDIPEDPNPRPDDLPPLVLVRDSKPEEEPNTSQDPVVDSKPEEPHTSSQVPLVTKPEEPQVSSDHNSSGSQVLITPRLPADDHSDLFTDLEDNYLLDYRQKEGLRSTLSSSL
ncbi:A type inclusion protein [Raccoonpox virus]|uniref:A-type inclusion protein n=1 Tax=Raccoon poxvirus TaxID=10256 RepID=A0A0G3G070_RACVI|nr:A-type inclusion protein [Raccoonpox virus]AKJ93774.1 A-type inclusion protein [Raccoonpox virus]AOP31406.1 A type inclusion protein [Raccoonpox virus]